MDRDTLVHTNTIKGTWAGVRLNIPNRNRTTANIEPFLGLFTFIKRNTSVSTFKLLLKNILKKKIKKKDFICILKQK